MKKLLLGGLLLSVCVALTSELFGAKPNLKFGGATVTFVQGDISAGTVGISYLTSAASNWTSIASLFPTSVKSQLTLPSGTMVVFYFDNNYGLGQPITIFNDTTFTISNCRLVSNAYTCNIVQS